MLHKFILLICLTASFVGFGQEVVATQGDSFSNGNGSIDFTIGEVVTNTVSNGTNDLTQGFQQTNWNFLGLENHAELINAVVFPNPMDQNLTIKTEDFDGVSYKMFDAQGRIVAESNLEAEESSIDVLNFTTGAYNLVLFKQNEKLKTFKLVKNQ